jgi:ER membrane protein complex subunit 4
MKALLSLNQPFSTLDSPTTRIRILQAKAVYSLMQLVVMALGVYKVWVMGLLPTSGSDFLAWKGEREVYPQNPLANTPYA